MNKQEISLIVFGCIILLCVSYFANAQRLAEVTDGNDYGFCKSEESLCAYLTAPIRPLLNRTIRQARSQANFGNVPVLKLYMTDGSLRKLNDKRNSAIREKRSILLSEPGDWVNADLIVESEQGSSRVKTRARLKGDWGDHLKDSKKRSLRIKVRNGKTVLGTSRFSIQHPMARGYHHEAMLFAAMKYHDVLTPKYFIVDVRVNNSDNGLMVFEEHFTKELIESQNRREGPVLTIDEDQMWRQWHLNANRTDVNWESYGMNFEQAIHYRPKDYPVRAYGSLIPQGTDVKSNNAIRGLSLYRRALDGDVPANQVFDLRRSARWFVLTNIFAATHGAAFHNLKFYFDPISGLLEPVAFDNHAPVLMPYKYRSTIFIDRLLADEEFGNHLQIAIGDVDQMLKDKDFQTEIEKIEARWLELLSLDDMKADLREYSELSENLERFKADLENAINETDAKKSQNHLDKRDPIRNRTFLEIESKVHTHLRAFLYTDNTGSYVEVKNLMHKPVQISGVYREEKDRSVRLAANIELAVDNNTSQNIHIWRHQLGNYSEFLSNRHYVEFSFQGTTYRQELTNQFRHIEQINSDAFLSEIANRLPTVTADQETKTIYFQPGQTALDRHYTINSDWSVVIRPGAQIQLKDGALLRIEGDLSAKGTEASPILVRVESLMDQRLGRWGGILVAGAPNIVELSHINFSGTGQSDLAERQDNLGLTGCLTIYGSKVDISQVTFDFMQCEDALNIVKSEFTISDTLFRRAFSDAFDADFSTGNIDASAFSQTGNDGLDISGSSVEITNSKFENIGDKAVSVGEASNLKAERLTIDTAVTGVASKDRSLAELLNSSFSAIQGSALIAYIKKQEYGPAGIQCDQCTFADAASIATTQTGSKIQIDGVEQDVTAFTEQNLLEIGLVP